MPHGHRSYLRSPRARPAVQEWLLDAGALPSGPGRVRKEPSRQPVPGVFSQLCVSEILDPFLALSLPRSTQVICGGRDDGARGGGLTSTACPLRRRPPIGLRALIPPRVSHDSSVVARLMLFRVRTLC